MILTELMINSLMVNQFESNFCRGDGITVAAGAFAPVRIWQRVQCTRPGE